MEIDLQVELSSELPQFFDAYIGFNNKKSPLDNVSLRRALAMAVDKKTIAERVLGGAVGETDHIVPLGMPGYYEDLKPLVFDAQPGAAPVPRRPPYSASRVGRLPRARVHPGGVAP